MFLGKLSLRFLTLTAALLFGANCFAQKETVKPLVVSSDEDARQIFTSFRFPPHVFFSHVSPPLSTGIYRLEINAAGEVSAITILKSMGYPYDISAEKAFVRWRATQGPFRLVDVHCMVPRTERYYRYRHW